MGAAYFYHLTEQPLERTLPVLLNKALAAGWRVAVRGRGADQLDWLDLALWQGDGFLPHGRAGGPHDAEQPVLLTERAEAPNGAVCVMAVDGAAVTADEVRDLERVCILFDGGNAAAVERARAQWRCLADAGCAAQYWAHRDGGWTKQAETGAAPASP